MSEQKKQERKFKSIEYDFNTRSNAVNHYLNKQMPGLIGGMVRIAQLIYKAKNEPELKAEIIRLITDIETKAHKQLETFDEQFEELVTGMELYVSELQGAPQTRQVIIGHPVMWKLVRLLKSVEERAVRVELFWLNEIIADEEVERCEKELDMILRYFRGSIYGMTSIEGRQGGKWDANQFLKELRARLERGEAFEVDEATEIALTEPREKKSNKAA